MSPEQVVQYVCDRQQMASQSGAFRRWVEHHVDDCHFTTKIVRLDEIDEDISHLNGDDADLRKGPPVLYRSGDSYKIIDGRHRIKAAHDLGIRGLVCWVPE